jgi:hypothetical protein
MIRISLKEAPTEKPGLLYVKSTHSYYIFTPINQSFPPKNRRFLLISRINLITGQRLAIFVDDRNILYKNRKTCKRENPVEGVTEPEYLRKTKPVLYPTIHENQRKKSPREKTLNNLILEKTKQLRSII